MDRNIYAILFEFTCWLDANGLLTFNPRIRDVRYLIQDFADNSRFTRPADDDDATNAKLGNRKD